jgi:hypothetical protein
VGVAALLNRYSDALDRLAPREEEGDRSAHPRGLVDGGMHEQAAALVLERDADGSALRAEKAGQCHAAAVVCRKQTPTGLRCRRRGRDEGARQRCGEQFRFSLVLAPRGWD